MSNDMIEVTGLDIAKFVETVYSLSQPMGMGFLHFRPGDIPDDALEGILKHCMENIEAAKLNKKRIDQYKQCVLNLDYILGRCCKQNLFIDHEEKLWIRNAWMDHHHFQLKDLLLAINMADKVDQIDTEYMPRN